MKQYKLYSLMLCLVGVLASCDSFLTTPPLDQIVDDQWWKTEEQAKMMVNNCYRYTYGTDEVALMDCITDNAKHRDGKWTEIGNGTYTTQSSIVKDKYKYGNIANLNYTLEGLDKSQEFISETTYKSLRAQVRFIRAFNYADMLFFFGDIPLITKTITVEESRSTSRQPKAEVLDFVVKELQAVLADIENEDVKESSRVNKHTVNALLARVFLRENDYANILKYTTPIIESNQYELYSDYEGFFRPQADANNKESIFERQYSYPLSVHALNRNLSTASSVYSGWAHVLPLQDLVDEYECEEGHAYEKCEELNCPNHAKRLAEATDTKRAEYLYRDPRLASTIIYPYWEWKVDGVTTSVYGVDDPLSKEYIKKATHMTGFLITKWVDLLGTSPLRTQGSKSMTILRYGDVLLMHAEALIETNQNLQGAVDILNQIRTRAKMPANVKVMTQGELRKVLRRERRIETAFEGLRYFDMIRWKIGADVRNSDVYGARLKAISDDMDHKFIEKRFWTDNMYLFPIPQEARDRNPNLTQNTGW